jgi:hypothetical protein
MSIERSVTLTPHPVVSAGGVRAIDVRVRRARDAVLGLRYRVTGDLDDVRVPVPATPRAADRLWEHTCFEAFVGVDGERAYHELNASPSGEWAIFAFRDTRDGGPLGGSAAPRIEFRRSREMLELEAELALDALSTAYRGAVLRIGLSAVVESTANALSYWALRHPAARPDFHHPEAFALRLEPA